MSRNNSYFILDTTRLTYDDARKACQSQGDNTDLAVVRSMEDLVALKEEMKKLLDGEMSYVWRDVFDNPSNIGFWVGGRSDDNSEEWNWVDEIAIPIPQNNDKVRAITLV